MRTECAITLLGFVLTLRTVSLMSAIAIQYPKQCLGKMLDKCVFMQCRYMARQVWAPICGSLNECLHILVAFPGCGVGRLLDLSLLASRVWTAPKICEMQVATTF